VTLSPSLMPSEGTAFTGRLIVVASTISGTSVLSRMNSATSGQPFWGLDVSGWKPGKAKTLSTDSAYGYPLERVKDLPPGDYYVQAFLNVYTQFTRSDGSVVWLHMPCGDGQSPTSSPGNLYSAVVPMHLDGMTSGTQVLTIDQMIPYPAGTSTFPDNSPNETCQQGNYVDSDHLKHIKIQSDLLTEFWGRPMYIGANVLLPMTYDQPGHEADQFPVVYNHGHWPGGNVQGFGETSTNTFSTWWRDPSTPQFIIVTIRHENPYYDDSYAVNSANLGPYGDAINQELIPAIDAQFRTYPERWARTLTGGSTGGWEVLASMVFYPDVYGGTWGISPDPVDFRYHQIVNVYSDANAYFTDRQWVDTPRPSQRNVAGNTSLTMDEENHWELALGTHWRSGKQWAVWAAVYGPQGPDGYPANIWDMETGVIDHTVSTAWQPMDLRLNIVNNWATLGPKLTGRFHDYGGDDDSYFLNDSSELLETAMAALTDPPANADFQWVHNGGHGASPYTTPQLLTIMYNAMIADMP
jgi:Putative esterase